MNVTLRTPLFLTTKVKLQPRALSNLYVNISRLIVLYLWVTGITKVSDDKSDLQTHSSSLASMLFDSPYMIFYLSSIVTVSILHHSRDIIAYFGKNKDVTWLWPRPFKGQFVIPILNHHLANHCTKYDIFSISHSGDIVGGTKNLNRSRDHNHAPFGGDFFILLVRLDIAHLCTKFDSSSFSHSWDMDGAPNLKWVTWRNTPLSGTVSYTHLTLPTIYSV